MNLELAAMRWLWIEQKCLVVLEERTPKYMMGLPDVLGVTPGRYLTEIEIKRSLSDFRADAKKPHRANREFYLAQMPRLFYYLVLPDMVEKVSNELPEWAGLMTQRRDLPLVDIIKRSPINKESKKLNLKQCTRLARQMTAHVMGYAIANNSIKEAYRGSVNFDFTDWVDCESGTYLI